MKYPVKGTPLSHQEKALKEAGEKPGHAFWMDPGAGKTYTCIAEAAKLFTEGKIDGMFVVAPNGPHIQWVEDELPKWADIPFTAVHNQELPQNIKAFFSKKNAGFPVASMNYDALRTKGGQKFIDDFYAKYPRVYLVGDESQKIKNDKAQRTKLFLDLASRSAYRRVLSGTPILKGLEDLFTQYEAVGNGLTGFESFIAYRNYFCQLAPIPGARSRFAQRIVGYRNENELLRITKPYATRVMSDEFMTGEEASFMKVAAPMNRDQAYKYATMVEHLIAEIDSGRIKAQNALVQMGKLLQIASGYLINEDGGYTQIGDNKLVAAIDLIESLNEPVLIWTPFIPLKEMMHNALIEEGYGDRVVLYNSQSDLAEWRKRENGIMIGNQSSGMGVGLNLQDAAANIYLANNFSSEARWQSVKRTDRIGQTKQVRVWDTVAPGTVDVKALASLQTKQDIASSNIDALRELLI